MLPSPSATSSLPWYLEDPDPEVYFQHDPLTLDLETTNKDHGDSREAENRIVLAAAAKGRAKARLEGLDNLGRACPGGPCLLVAHNAKFELAWLLRLGFDLSQFLVWDTMLAEWVLAGNRPVKLSLDATARRYGLPGKDPVIDALMRGGVCPSEIPRKRLEARVLRDVEVTRDLFYLQRERLRADGLLPVMLTRCLLPPILAHIERNGLRLDEPRVSAEVMVQRRRAADAEVALTKATGGINTKSGKQLSEYLFGKLGFQPPCDRRGNPKLTKHGWYQTSKEILEGLKAETEEQREFLRLRSEHAAATDRLSKSLLFFEEVCKRGGTFFGNIRQGGTKTHRLASSGKRILCRDGKERGAQLQNLPNEYKPLFVPKDPDYVLVESDGAGLEFRVAVELARDEQGKRDILDPSHDPHTFTASVISGRSPETVTKAQRRDAKKHTFKPLFSEGKSGTKREQAYYATFKERYAGITRLQEEWIALALRTGQVRLASGMLSYWTLRVERSGFISGANELRNLPIQSFATADIIPISLAYTFWRSYDLRVKTVNTVHDSVIAEVHKEDVDAYRKIVIQGFLDDTYKYLDTVYGHVMWVPLGVGFTVGPRWSEGTEEKYSEEYAKP